MNRNGVWRQALLIAGKDVRILFTDRMAILFMIAFPLLMVAAFANIMGPGFMPQDTQMEIVMVTGEAPGSISDQIIEGMAETEARIKVNRMMLAEAHQLVLDGKLGGYIEFPDGFSAAVMAGRPATLKVFVHPDGQNTKPLLDAVASTLATEFDAYWVRIKATTDLAVRFGGPEVMARLGEILSGSLGDGHGEGHTGAMDVAYTQVGPAVNKAATTYLLPGYVTMFIFFGLALSAEALVGERENQTLDRLIASRASRGSILLGKYLGNVGRGTIQAIILLGVGRLLFKVDLGYAPWATFVVTFAIVLCASSLGLAMATVARTRGSANTIAVFGSLMMAPLGGCWWPLWIMPHWMQAVARITPHAWANTAFAKLLYFAGSPASVVGEVAALLAFGAAFGAVAGLKFRVE